MLRWIAVIAAVALVAGVAFGQSAPEPQPMMDGGMMGMEPGSMPSMGMMGAMGGGPGWGMMCAGGMGMTGRGMTGRGMTGMGMSGMAMAGMGGSPMMGGAMMGSASSYLEARLAFARSELAIAGPQDAAWTAYATALRATSQEMPMSMGGAQQGMAGSFPDRLGMQISFLEARAGELKAVRDAALALYAQLDDAQKRKADTLLPMSLCM